MDDQITAENRTTLIQLENVNTNSSSETEQLWLEEGDTVAGPADQHLPGQVSTNLDKQQATWTAKSPAKDFEIPFTQSVNREVYISDLNLHDNLPIHEDR
jgi:hypothetical protein